MTKSIILSYFLSFRKRGSAIDDHSFTNADPTYSSVEEVRESVHDDMYVVTV